MALPSALPTPNLPDPHGVPSLRWGVVGPGGIAESFVSAVLQFTGQRFEAVASTDIARARAFADRHNIGTAYGSYDELFADENVDVVYVSTRQEAHLKPVLDAIAAGKHVLVEKPITMLPSEAHQIRDAAAAAGVFVMEAMWTSYLPQAYIIRSLIADGVLGDTRLVQADLGQDLRHAARLWDARGGGAALDLGIYPISFAGQFMTGAPTKISAQGTLAESGVDQESTIRLEYANGAIAQAHSSMLAFSGTAAWVDGEHASLALERPFFVPTTLHLFPREFGEKAVASWSDTSPIQGHLGLCYQATALAGFVADGLTQSPFRPLDHSVRDIEIIAEARHLLGQRYPQE